VLSIDELQGLMDAIRDCYEIQEQAEITLEANPDDISSDLLSHWQELGVNRLSIGIQSFQENELSNMNRSHSAAQALDCIDLVRESGVSNFSIDLIYGSQETSLDDWVKNLSHVIELDVPHLSAYALTVEPKTALAHKIKTGAQRPVSDVALSEQYEELIQRMKVASYDHYEISNFAKPDFEAIHNTNYWKGIEYIGLGPAAHSFKGTTRQWNVSNNARYIRSISDSKIPCEIETLSTKDQFNEYLLTHLRTKWGCNWEEMSERFDRNLIDEVKAKVPGLVKNSWAQTFESGFHLNEKGMFLSDGIISDLMQ